jgi:pSer/pThr/pTyr-binding forkhead associated (FHA) protein
MQNLVTSQTTEMSLELFHVQTNTSFEIPSNSIIISIGKSNDKFLPDIDVSVLPNTDIVSRMHAEINVIENNYYIQDLSSSNGTFINDTKLESKTPYKLNLGDKIDLGQRSQVSFIFQEKQEITFNSKTAAINPVTVLQSEIAVENKATLVDRTSRITGLALMVAAIIILAANTHLGIFVRIPGVLLCIAGVAVLAQRRFNRNIGWILIALGVVVILFTANILTSVNFLAILASSALFFVGYQLFNTGKVLNYSLRSLKGLLKK